MFREILYKFLRCHAAECCGTVGDRVLGKGLIHSLDAKLRSNERVLELMAFYFRREWKEDVCIRGRPREWMEDRKLMSEGGEDGDGDGGGEVRREDRSIVTHIKIPIFRLRITSVVYHANRTS